MTKFSYRILPFSQRLFLSVIFLFLGYAVCFMLFQYKREKAYKIELLNTQLQNYNNQLCDFLADHHGVNSDSMQSYVTTHMMPNLRVMRIHNLISVRVSAWDIRSNFNSNFLFAIFRTLFKVNNDE